GGHLPALFPGHPDSGKCAVRPWPGAGVGKPASGSHRWTHTGLQSGGWRSGHAFVVACGPDVTNVKLVHFTTQVIENALQIRIIFIMECGRDGKFLTDETTPALSSQHPLAGADGSATSSCTAGVSGSHS